MLHQDYMDHLYHPDMGGGSSLHLNEDLKTLGHNLWTRGFGLGMHSFNLKRLTIPLPQNIVGVLSNVFHGADKVDYAYFDSMYTITDKVRARLLSILQRGYKDAVIVGQNGIQGGTNSHVFDLNGKKSGLASRHMRQATSGFGGITTTATCFYKLPTKGGYYIIYFTFDGSGIQNCQVLCKKPGSDNESYESYYTRKVPEFSQIPESEYKK